MGTQEKPEQREPDDGLGSAEAAETLKWQFYDLDFSLNKSRRYHEKMASFYGVWRDVSKIVTVVAGSGAFLLVAGGTGAVGIAASALAALWSILDLILTPDKKAERHTLLRQRFTILAQELAGAEYSQAQLRVITFERLRLEADEPPCKRLVDLEARNDEARARNHSPDDLVPLSGWQRRFGRFCDFDMERLERWRADRTRALAASQLS